MSWEQVNVWGGEKAGSVGDRALALSDIEQVLAIFSDAEIQHRLAGQMMCVCLNTSTVWIRVLNLEFHCTNHRDVLLELSSQADVALPTLSEPAATLKRAREASSTAVPQAKASSSSSSSIPQSRPTSSEHPSPSPSASRHLPTSTATAPRRTSGASARARKSVGSRPASIHEGLPPPSSASLYANQSAQGSSSSLHGLGAQGRGMAQASGDGTAGMYGMGAVGGQATSSHGSGMGMANGGGMGGGTAAGGSYGLSPSSAANGGGAWSYGQPSSNGPYSNFGNGAQPSQGGQGMPPNVDLASLFPFTTDPNDLARQTAMFQLLQGGSNGGASGLPGGGSYANSAPQQQRGFPPNPSPIPYSQYSSAGIGPTFFDSLPQTSQVFQSGLPPSHLPSHGQHIPPSSNPSHARQSSQDQQFAMFGSPPAAAASAASGFPDFAGGGGEGASGDFSNLFNPALFGEPQGSGSAAFGADGNANGMDDLWDAVPPSFGCVLLSLSFRA